MTVLDASAMLALVHDEPGADIVAAEIRDASLSAANLAEVVGKLVDADIDVTNLRQLLRAAGVRSRSLVAELLGERRQAAAEE